MSTSRAASQPATTPLHFSPLPDLPARTREHLQLRPRPRLRFHASSARARSGQRRRDAAGLLSRRA